MWRCRESNPGPKWKIRSMPRVSSIYKFSSPGAPIDRSHTTSISVFLRFALVHGYAPACFKRHHGLRATGGSHRDGMAS